MNTKMPDVNDVIKKLEEVKRYIKFDNIPAHSLAALLTIEDALALLKAQEPRVLTLEEAVVAELMYYEPRYVHHGVTNGLFPVIRKVDRFCDRVEWYSPYFPDGKVHCLFTPDEYGVFSRCWTSRPTDAQREAEPWQ